jgi:hypothetical protein
MICSVVMNARRCSRRKALSTAEPRENLRFGRRSPSERWRHAGWLGGVLAAEWEACSKAACYQRDLRVCRFGSGTQPGQPA